MSKSALLLLLLGAGAFGVGYFTATTTQSAPPIAETPFDIEVGSDVNTPRSSTLIDGADAPTSSGPSLHATPYADDLTPIREAVATYEHLPLVRGAGTIEGTILTEDGVGLSGVRVTATPARDRPAMPFIEDLEERLLRSVRRQIEHHQWLRANIIETTTDASGAYLLEGLENRDHQISARREGWNVRPRDWQRARKAKPGPDALPFIARPKSGVRLILTQPDGAPVSRARLQFYRQGDSNQRGRRNWNASRPDVESSPGAYRLEVTAGEYNHLYAGPIDVEVVSGEIAPLQVELKERPVVVLSVAFAEGEEMGGRLYQMPVDSSETPSEVELKAGGEEKGIWAAPGQQARHVIDNVQANYVAVGFTRSYRGRLEVIDVIRLKDGINQHKLQVPALGAGAAMKVRVFTSDGEPVSDARVAPRFSGGSAQAWGAASAHRGAGEYLVIHPEGSGNGTYTVHVTAPGIGFKEVDYDPGNTGVLDVRLDAPAKLTLQVEDLPSTSGSVLAILNSKPRRGRPQEVVVNAEGTATFAGTQPGTYRLELQMGPRRGRRRNVHAEDIELDSGERRFVLEMPELHTVTIRGASGNVSIQQQVNRKDRNARRNAYSATKRATEGQAMFANLPPGEYTARSGRKRAKFRLPGSTTIVLEEPK